MLNRGFFRAALAVGLVSAAVTVTPPPALAANGSPGSDATAAIVAWNAQSLAVSLAEPLNPPLEGRNIAIESAAVYDAVISIIPRFDRTRSGSESGARPRRRRRPTPPRTRR